MEEQRELERLLREFKPRNGAEHFDANIGVMHALYECLSACTLYFVDSGQARTALRSAVGGDVQRYAMACVDARQLLWSEDIFAGYHGIELSRCAAACKFRGRPRFLRKRNLGPEREAHDAFTQTHAGGVAAPQLLPDHHRLLPAPRCRV